MSMGHQDTFMKTIALILLLVAATLAKAAAGFVSEPGRHVFFDGKVVVEVESRNEFIHYMISNERKAGAGCKEDRVLSSSHWFIYPESASKIWIYEGGGNLKLMEFRDASIKVSDTRAVPALMDSAPKSVREKHLEGMRPAP